MTALAGFDPLDPVSIGAEREDYHAAIGRDVRALRIGIPRSPFFEDLDPEIDAAVRAAIDVLVGLTGPTRDVSVAAPDTYALLDAETYAYHAPLLADPAKRALYQPLTLPRVLGGASVTAQSTSSSAGACRSRATPSAMCSPTSTCSLRRRACRRRQRSKTCSRTRRARALDPQHAAVQRVRNSGDQCAVRVHARRVADRHADHRPAPR